LDLDYIFDRGKAGVCARCGMDKIVAWSHKANKFLCRIHYIEVENSVDKEDDR